MLQLAGPGVAWRIITLREQTHSGNALKLNAIFNEYK